MNFKRARDPWVHVLILIGFVSLGATNLAAAARTYETRRPVGELVAALIDRLPSAGFVFSVQTVYDPQSDGKQGFVLRLAPGGKLCEILFAQDPTRKDRSIVRSLASDAADEARLHQFFTKNMGMKEVGVNDDFDDSNPWPVQIN